MRARAGAGAGARARARTREEEEGGATGEREREERERETEEETDGDGGEARERAKGGAVESNTQSGADRRWCRGSQTRHFRCFLCCSSTLLKMMDLPRRSVHPSVHPSIHPEANKQALPPPPPPPNFAPSIAAHSVVVRLATIARAAPDPSFLFRPQSIKLPIAVASFFLPLSSPAVTALAPTSPWIRQLNRRSMRGTPREAAKLLPSDQSCTAVTLTGHPRRVDPPPTPQGGSSTSRWAEIPS
ncbi:hypothetical protein BO71DRAFT_59618 [Aspergillus ellipticus CBS 707.79]|uniref:Uncharacterized protein n=1 Tax=Aspergillus ellipticus CBS 707.79 TaxID=1448320 RepID=A0A319D231_9EURO|nr:hypothetical protein BO71DRAFT_59618 [Aspergillus ellipticus CBS 707.79]